MVGICLFAEILARICLPSGDQASSAVENISVSSSAIWVDALWRGSSCRLLISSTKIPFFLGSLSLPADGDATKAILLKEGSIMGFEIPVEVILSNFGAVGNNLASAFETTSF